MVGNQLKKNVINGLATVVKGLLTMASNQFEKNKINWLATIITVANQFTKNKINWLATIEKRPLTTVANQFTNLFVNWLVTVMVYNGRQSIYKKWNKLIGDPTTVANQSTKSLYQVNTTWKIFCSRIWRRPIVIVKILISFC